MLICVEPSLLSFDAFKKINNYKDADGEFEDFKKFIKNLEGTLQQLQNSNCKISISKDLWSEIVRCLPVSVYGTDTRYKIARELYLIKLPKYVKSIHSYGDHNYEGTCDQNSIANSQLLELELYILWVDLLIANALNKNPQSLVKSILLSICNSDKILITCEASDLEYLIHNDVSAILTCKNVIKAELKQLLTKQSKSTGISCSGTGDHDSMWGKKIRGIEDIPIFERLLFNRLLQTNVVLDITFLDFNKKSNPSEEPSIKIIEVVNGAESDVMHCMLLGRGSKQNSQKISLKVKSGFGAKIYKASESSITEKFLESILS